MQAAGQQARARGHGHCLHAYPHAPVVAVICDNGTIHHSGITRRWLADHPRLLLLHGARYSPQDNPTERVWAAMKADIANTAPATMADRIRQAHAFFRNHTPAQMLAATVPWTSPRLPEGYGQDFPRRLADEAASWPADWAGWRLRAALLDLDGVGVTTATKLMARKRPRLRPMWDPPPACPAPP
ncbi:DUF6308 family protein [Longispora urticae]